MSYLFVAFVAFTLGCMFAHGSDRRRMRDLVQRTRKYRLRCQGYDNLVDMNRHLQRELSSRQHEYDVLRRKYDRLRRN